MMKGIRATAAEETGWAMPIVVTMIALITVLTFGAYAVSSQALKESSFVQGESVAFQAANAGVDQAMAHLPGGQTGTYTISASQLGTGATAVVNIEKVSVFTYKLTSTGYAYGQNSEQISTEFSRFDLYGMNVSAGGSGDMWSTGAVKGNSAVYGPYYTGAGIATGRFYEGPLFVSGNITGGTFNGIGDAYYGGTLGGLTATHLNSSVPKMPPLPSIDAVKMQGYVDVARAQSVDNVMGDWTTAIQEAQVTGVPGTYNTWPSARKSYATAMGWAAASYPYYKYIGPIGGMSALGAGTTNVVINSSTPSFGKFPSSPSIGATGYDDFAWDSAQKVLYVSGTVFIDGAFTVAMDKENVKYMGNGAIVANGPIHITAGTFGPMEGMVDGVVNGTTLAHQNFPANACVGFVSPTEIHLTGAPGNSDKSRSDDPDIAGAFYCPAQIRFEKNILVAGSMITNLMVGPGNGNNVHIRTSPTLVDVAPQGMPARNEGLMGYSKWIRK
jgi:hypothetical protein